MLDLSEQQRAVLIDKLPDTANVARGALGFGQWVSGQPFSTTTATIGVGLWTAMMIAVLLLARGRK